jgi:eukaryotic-like serine/threonine-protein kinase
MIGSTLEHYRIESQLGQGGMGVVYRARDSRLDRIVALKVLQPDKVADPARKHRFIQEARAASALNHPNIVTIHDVRSDKGVDFIVMEHITGRTLERVIPSSGMPATQALTYAVQIADALAAAHAAGLVHRDLKPANVMVTDDGRVKILDFGVAKLVEPADPSVEETKFAAPVTEDGALVGTPAYMSPEQAERRTVDGRSDIFSLGTILYEMVTGRRPFAGDSWLAVLSAILKDDPTPPAQLAAIPSPLEQIVLRCLRKDPARRYQTMADLKVALQDAAEEQAVRKPLTASSSWRRWSPVALVPLLVGAGVLGWWVLRAPESSEPLRAVPLTSLPGVERYPSFSPDGDRVAFTWTGSGQNNPDIYVQQIGAGSPLRLTTNARSDFNPVWSPDGRWVAFIRGDLSTLSGIVANGELRLIPPLGGPERRLSDVRVRQTVSNPGFLAWCPDSRCLVVTDSPGEGRPDALFVVSLDSGEKRQLTSLEPPAYGDTNPAISPDGRALVFRRNRAFAAGELHWLALGEGVTADGEPRRLTLAPLDAAYPVWMPEGDEILFSAQGSLWRLPVNGDGTADGSPARLPFVGEDGLMPAVSRPQPGRPLRLVYVRSFDDLNIWRVSTSAPGAPSTSPPVVAISSTRLDHQAHYSPDGTRVAFQSNRSGKDEIWLADPDGGGAVQLTSMGAPVTAHAGWSPDGKSLVFDSNQDGQFEIHVIPAGGGKPQRLTSHPASDHYPSFSRDGRWIYFASNRTGEYQVSKMPANGGDVVQFTRRGGWVAVEAIDGAHAYYTETTGTVPTALWRQPTSGGEPVKVLDAIVQRAFDVVETGIYYIDQPAEDARLRFLDFATGTSTTVAPTLGDVASGLTASPDGRTILYTRRDSSVDDLVLVEDFR